MLPNMKHQSYGQEETLNAICRDYAASAALRATHAIHAQASGSRRINGAENPPTLFTPALGDIFSEIRTGVADIYDATAIVSDLKMRAEYNARSRLDISRDFALLEKASGIDFIFQCLRLHPREAAAVV